MLHLNTALKVSVFGVLLARTFPHSNWMRIDTPYLSIFSLNAGKYGSEKLRIRTLFMWWDLLLKMLQLNHGSFISIILIFASPTDLSEKKTRSRSTCLVGLGQVCPFSLRVLQKWPKIKVPKSTIMLCKPQI